MIKSIKVNNKDTGYHNWFDDEGKLSMTTEGVFLFNEIKDCKRMNILFGGNGCGKSTLLKCLQEGLLDIEENNDNGIEFLSYKNSEDNSMHKSMRDNGFSSQKDFVLTGYGAKVSEGQNIIMNLLHLFEEIKAYQTDKDLVVLLDEIDSGLSVENINMILHIITDILNNTDSIQFFIATNHYHFTYAFKEILNLYNGKYERIESYEDYFNKLNNGIQIMNNSGKRNFGFLNIFDFKD